MLNSEGQDMAKEMINIKARATHRGNFHAVNRMQYLLYPPILVILYSWMVFDFSDSFKLERNAEGIQVGLLRELPDIERKLDVFTKCKAVFRLNILSSKLLVNIRCYKKKTVNNND